MIFSRFSLPKVLKRMHMEDSECIITERALDAIIQRYSSTSGIRDLEQGSRAHCSKCPVSDRGQPCGEGRVYQRDGGRTSEIDHIKKCNIDMSLDFLLLT